MRTVRTERLRSLLRWRLLEVRTATPDHVCERCGGHAQPCGHLLPAQPGVVPGQHIGNLHIGQGPGSPENGPLQ